MGKKERRDDFSAVVKGRTEGARGMKNRLILVTCLSPGNRLISRAGLLPRATSEFMVLQELGLCCRPCPMLLRSLGSGLPPVANLVSESGETSGNHVVLPTMLTSEPWLWHRPMSVSIVLLQPRSVLVSVAPDTTKGHVNAMDLGSYLRLC